MQHVVAGGRMPSIGERVRSIGSHQAATFSGHYKSWAYFFMAVDMSLMFRLPPEIRNMLFDAADHIVWNEIPGTRVLKHLFPARRAIFGDGKASIPPKNRSCPFIDDLPAEIRRKIFIDELDCLPARHRPIYPVCGNDEGVHEAHHKMSNPLTNLLLISRKIRDEITEVVYEERTFGIHVHQGFKDAGIEFLHVGRQPLQYLDHIGDGRFTKFRTGEMFGFCRLKKIEIHIFPDNGAYQHSAINTYFMNMALARLLARSNERQVDRITLIWIVFPDEDVFKPSTVGSWWDTARDRPRETSIHGISDVELVLRPFALLSHVHQVDIQLPETVDRHVRSVKFVQSLVRCMTATTLQDTFNSDDLERKIESARYALEDHIRRKLYGSGIYTYGPQITDGELEDNKQSQEPEDSDEMEITSGDESSEDQSSNDQHDDEVPPAAQDATDQSMFDEADGFPEDLDTPGFDEPVAPNAMSEKVIKFIECLPVTGDVARRFLHLSGGNLNDALAAATEHL